ncbi:hypothetical protein QBC32DRAFT_272030 [Pseudoneurospora amorphoporcata]|uniref:Uncharacterized protein n=1 Tax=Pseudoneurospora amorphoporcata TaxID=241081 RepID=A0AAN6SAM7_9PEZI|nr:hypothetical protein QBC32DRAFT_272030 [Pseudoneurospora amorphoporcata]
MTYRTVSSTPFQTALFPLSLTTYSTIHSTTNPPSLTSYTHFFPASHRNIRPHEAIDDLESLYKGPSPSFIAREFDLSRLHSIRHLLWLAGRPVPPRPLHQQVLMNREPIVTEQLEQHLVWGGGRVFLKPISKFLLTREFWTRELTCKGEESCRGAVVVLSNRERERDREANDKGQKKDDAGVCKRCESRQAALGFLFSYVGLVQRESDFNLATVKGLLPGEITWDQWRLFVDELLAPRNAIYKNIAVRFIYGELRLNRLNLIYMFTRGPLSLGFMAIWTSYGQFVVQNSAWVIGGTAWIVVVLSGMQVGWDTTLGEEEAFKRASYGFAVFSILGPISAMVLIFTYMVVLFVWNLVRTRRFEVQRSQRLGRTWSGLHLETGRSGMRTGMGTGMEMEMGTLGRGRTGDMEV